MKKFHELELINEYNLRLYLDNILSTEYSKSKFNFDCTFKLNIKEHFDEQVKNIDGEIIVCKKFTYNIEAILTNDRNFRELLHLNYSISGNYAKKRKCMYDFLKNLRLSLR